MKAYELITVLGPTASGKTSFAAALGRHLDAEIISADSRQVYRRMDIGTGKDLDDYRVDGVSVPYHLIDICEPGTQYNVFEYQHDFFRVYQQIRAQNKLPILCGGTGLYIESVLKGYQLLDVPPNPALRESLKDKSLSELEMILASYKTLHNKTDVDSAQRAIRAIEIEVFYQQYAQTSGSIPPSLQGETTHSEWLHCVCNSEQRHCEYTPPHTLIIGINIDRELRRQKITNRLHYRLENGMVDEVRHLLDSGVPSGDLISYGLEYKFLTQYIIGEIAYNEMVSLLEIAIHQFAKRQMTWFRGMERRGFTIHWIDASIPTADKIEQTLALLKN
jgi:tRNA dimethylallyltransferase